nr:MAG TPA: hypothetical protein [Caudoviricetes sp.]
MIYSCKNVPLIYSKFCDGSMETVTLCNAISFDMFFL